MQHFYKNVTISIMFWVLPYKTVTTSACAAPLSTKEGLERCLFCRQLFRSLPFLLCFETCHTKQLQQAPVPHHCLLKKALIVACFADKYSDVSPMFSRCRRNFLILHGSAKPDVSPITRKHRQHLHFPMVSLNAGETSARPRDYASLLDYSIQLFRTSAMNTDHYVDLHEFVCK